MVGKFYDVVGIFTQCTSMTDAQHSHCIYIELKIMTLDWNDQFIIHLHTVV